MILKWQMTVVTESIVFLERGLLCPKVGLRLMLKYVRDVLSMPCDVCPLPSL